MNSYNVKTELQDLDVEELKEINYKDRLNFAVCCFNILGDLNVGMIIRTANLMGAKKVIVVGKKQWDRRSSVGTHHYIDIEFIKGFTDFDEPDPMEFKDCMERNNFVPVMIETGGWDISRMKGDLVNIKNKTPCLVFGCEQGGIPDEIKKQGVIYTIKQYGVIRCLNVSASAAIAMYEMGR